MTPTCSTKARSSSSERDRTKKTKKALKVEATVEGAPLFATSQTSQTSHHETSDEPLGYRNILDPATPLSYKLEKKSTESRHPDAIKRRLRAERRKKQRRMVYQSLSDGMGWWQIECASNIVIATCSDEFYHAMRVGRNEGKDVIVQYFSPNCFACKEEAIHCAQIAVENPDKLFVRVHYERCKAVTDLHGIKKLPWIQYFKHEEKDQRKPANEGLHLCTFGDLLHVPEGLEVGSSKHCVVKSASSAGNGNFDALLQAIHL